jgi:hypothetical protein
MKIIRANKKENQGYLFSIFLAGNLLERSNTILRSVVKIPRD